MDYQTAKELEKGDKVYLIENPHDESPELTKVTVVENDVILDGTVLIRFGEIWADKRWVGHERIEKRATNHVRKLENKESEKSNFEILGEKLINVYYKLYKGG